MNKLIQTSDYANIIFKSPDNESFFYGYYNTLQLDVTNQRLLAQKIAFENRMPDIDDEIEIGYFDLKSGSWQQIGKSRAFNWQQGSHLQWIGPSYNDKVLYNDREGNNFVTKIFSLKNNETTTLNFPSYAVDPNGQFSISIDYHRAHWTRAYSYPSYKIDGLDRDITDKDGFFYLDLKSGEIKQIFELKKWIELNKIALDQGVRHWVEHPMLNHDGTLLFGYYRFGDKNSYKTIGVILEPKSGNQIHQVLLGAREEFSHIGWNRMNEIAMFISPWKQITEFLRNPQKSNRIMQLGIKVYRSLIRPFVPRKIIQKTTKLNSFYRIYRYWDQRHMDIHKIELSIDGHPSFTKDGNFMLTDTYQDGENYRNLYLFHLPTEKIYLLGRFYSYVNNMGWRADLHPRFSLDEKYVMIDSNTNGYHQVIVIEINWGKLLIDK